MLPIAKPNQADIWLVDTGRLSANPDVIAFPLPADQKERATRFHFDHDRVRYIASHVALQKVLGEYTGLKPGEISFQTTPKGKPHLNGDHRALTAFNLSHSADYALIAVTRGVEVGVDIERHRYSIEYVDLSERFFTLAEREWLDALPSGSRAEGFFRVWSAKEALLKALGTGLLAPLREVGVRLESEHRIAFDSKAQADIGRWKGCELNLVPGYSAAVVMEAKGGSPEVVVRRFDFR